MVRRAAVLAVATGVIAPAAAPAATPVARVLALEGHAAYVKHGGHLRRLHRGQHLKRGAWLVVGPRTHVRIVVLLGKRSKLPGATRILYITRYLTAAPPAARKVRHDVAVDAGYAKYYPVLRVTNDAMSLRAR